jgi:hypothetical protein
MVRKKINLKNQKGKDKRKLTVHADVKFLPKDKYHKTIISLAAQ